MERAEGALLSTAETVPGARPTCSATARNVTVPDELCRELFTLDILGDYCRPARDPHLPFVATVGKLRQRYLAFSDRNASVIFRTFNDRRTLSRSTLLFNCTVTDSLG